MKIARYNGGKIGIVTGTNIVDVTRACGMDPGRHRRPSASTG